MPKLTVSKDSIKGFTPVPEGLYDLRLEGFKLKKIKDKDSVLYGPQLKITNGPFAGRPVWPFVATSTPWIQNDFCHAFGFGMKEEPDGSVGIPGTFDGPEGIENCEQWVYKGPLLGRTCKAYVIISSYNGKPKNEIKYYICSIADCNKQFPETTHSTDLTKNSKG